MLGKAETGPRPLQTLCIVCFVCFPLTYKAIPLGKKYKPEEELKLILELCSSVLPPDRAGVHYKGQTWERKLCKVSCSLAYMRIFSPCPWVYSTVTVQRFIDCWHIVTGDILIIWKCKSTHLNAFGEPPQSLLPCEVAYDPHHCWESLAAAIKWVDSSSWIWLQ